ncbi:MAG: hypothetical protein GY821_15835 [Gammaproteobacteria bacterium]|nr:hypothetical protein [Gammaproteobacteria bacterium]
MRQNLLASCCLPHYSARYCLAPFLYHFLTDTINGAYLNRPHGSPNDLLSFIIPEPFMQFITPFTVKLSSHFISNLSEHNGYLGFPLIILIVLFGWRHWRKAGTKYLLSLVLIYACLSLSSTWFFNGNKLLVFFPSHCFFYWLPFIKYSLASRYALYTSFVVAIIVARWLHNRHPLRRVNSAKYLLALLAILSLLPCIKPIKKLHTEPWSRIYIQLDYNKPFFTDVQLYQKWLKRGENILIIPTDMATWYQLQSDFYFKVAMAYLGAPPLAQKQSDVFALVDKKQLSNGVTAAQFNQFLRQRQINAVIITNPNYQAITPLLEQLAIKPIHVGGVWLYRFS